MIVSKVESYFQSDNDLALLPLEPLRWSNIKNKESGIGKFERYSRRKFVQ